MKSQSLSFAVTWPQQPKQQKHCTVVNIDHHRHQSQDHTGMQQNVDTMKMINMYCILLNETLLSGVEGVWNGGGHMNSTALR